MSYPYDLNELAQHIKQWGQALGFQQVGICDTDLSAEEPRLQAWLDKQYHGEMDWMARHGMLRARPHELLPGTLRVISVRMNYLPAKAAFASTLKNPELGYVSRYALGRDYHKLLRQRLKKLGDQIQEYCGELNFRPFVDSAPIMERPLAAKAGLGWVGKHSLILNREAGSWFFLGELLIDLPLPVDRPQEEQCGRCVACMTTCPTGAIVAPYTVDARRCISYLTIELEGPIPEEFRPLMGNRIYGCDDCQLICPWNRFSQLTDEADFSPRAALHTPELLVLFGWNEEKFLRITEGSPIRRIGHLRWLRNIAVALGNAPYQDNIVLALQTRLGESELLDEHIHWAIQQQLARRALLEIDVQSTQKKRLIRAVEKGLPRDA
ncbi:tRNA epoxyqueuosine(34) reductase QueG [Pectobacterium parmentieri]|uniref:Epoxyqueuosine reductase n=1 Tax=Pectobacterium parmentieri TaxID=1905730 RepID=A0A8B3FER7_PECPM|nr:tRNA epoxyqueuosine(34) reductase QueG [Pectobacterium parmentieri]ACX89656.1 iron-sulfur cluster binding protein [Pectobacterium parmentieri WPP163]AOR61506.1 tRNA epoxyqueuosine(34) reductase QueG [Pectobacterium parmentieri]AYH03048.1 tRNA epoxyqueuosine(34) reductase QueG [Pectobacterium parmentieri]AYH07311.1 tRNA epoxyqueuosine(34) reductase QueG [Pectobacterium parmentieri]AYH11835.1 tRNA epoxyqueuosine(34) reductase QueG [Pectobacterium parmentieri]